MSNIESFITIIDEVARLRGRLRELFAPVRNTAGLSEIEMAVLNAVVEATAPPTVPRIGRSLGHPRQVIQRTVNTLIDRGLIAPAANPDHKRAALLFVTAPGAALKTQTNTHAETLAAPLVASIDANALRDAATVLHQLRTALEVAAPVSGDRK